jgi:PleD family two-component response regulator
MQLMQDADAQYNVVPTRPRKGGMTSDSIQDTSVTTYIVSDDQMPEMDGVRFLERQEMTPAVLARLANMASPTSLRTKVTVLDASAHEIPFESLPHSQSSRAVVPTS